MIKLAVATYELARPAVPMSAVFGPVRQTVGRGEDNHFVLPDPGNAVARSQAAVWSDGAVHTIVSLSDATPVRVNGAEIDTGKETALRIGDQVGIGPYVLRVEDPAGMSLVPARPRPAASGAAPAPAAAVGSAASGSDALKQAFLRGAGLPADAISSDLTPELMELAGKLLASSLQGAIDLLALRSLVKQEARADVTMVVVRNNNPLKFFPDSQTVLTQMLRKKMPGFMEPLEAVEDAWHDLHGHQMGVVAGTRASMNAMMARLDPARFEAALKPGGMADALIPSRRPAALWALYTAQFDTLALEAKDQFKSLFGEAFLAAYEREVERCNLGAAR